MDTVLPNLILDNASTGKSYCEYKNDTCSDGILSNCDDSWNTNPNVGLQEPTSPAVNVHYIFIKIGEEKLLNKNCNE